jgi:hypothetical protein
MGDVDLLVPVDAADRAAAVLDGDLGYEPVLDVPPDHHHLLPRARPGHVGVVELHTGLHDRRSPAPLDPAQVLDRARPWPGRPGLRLDRTDAATHLVAHAQLHPSTSGRLAMDLRALHQTALVVRRVPDVDWDEARRRFARVGAARRFDTHLAVAAEVFAVPCPVRPQFAGRGAARLELVFADHPALALLDRPTRRLAVLRRAGLERYFHTTLTGAALWRARARYLGEVARRRRDLAVEAADRG